MVSAGWTAGEKKRKKKKEKKRKRTENETKKEQKKKKKKKKKPTRPISRSLASFSVAETIMSLNEPIRFN